MGASMNQGQPAQPAAGMKKKLGAFHLWILGVGLVISGNYFGWNFGISAGGYVGMMIAVVLMAAMYLGLVLGIAELATLMPHTGGPYAYARRSMGSLAGFLTGVGVVLEYFLAAPVVALGIGGYVNFLFPGVSPVLVALALYVFFVGVHLLGIQEYALLETVLVMLALFLLVLFYGMGFPRMSASTLLGGSGDLVPGGVKGIWACLPYAMWLFLAVEILPMLSEECRDPRRDMPRALIWSMATLLILAVLTTTVAIGLGGTKLVSASPNPLPDSAAAVLGRRHWLTGLLASVGLVGLVASFSGVLLGYSRQVFALSRAGYLPLFLSRLHPARGTPTWALVLPSAVGLALVVLCRPENLILLATFGALVSYISMNVSLVLLRIREPYLERSYRVPGYPWTPCVSIFLAVIALFSSVFKNWLWFFVCLGVFSLAAAYYYVWARHRINTEAPEERTEAVFSE